MVISQLGYGGAEGSFLRLASFLSRYFDVTIALMARDYGSPDYSNAQSQTDLPMVMLDDGRSSANAAYCSKCCAGGRWYGGCANSSANTT